MHSARDDAVFQSYLQESTVKFSGWDFSYLNGRMDTEPLEWSYRAKLMPYLLDAETLLDMGTGGGEFFSKLSPIPLKSYATEGYPPNFEIAKKRLSKLDITVKPVKTDLHLDFSDNFFDLVINRHEEYSIMELGRIIKPKKHFITQQVGGTDNSRIRELLNADISNEYENWNVNFISEQLAENGFKIIEAQECFPVTRLFDVGALIYYLNAIPWEIEDFTIEKYRDQLYEIHKIIKKETFIEIDNHRILIIAQRTE